VISKSAPGVLGWKKEKKENDEKSECNASNKFPLFFGGGDFNHPLPV
jgi:hypothetical protein